MHLLLILTSLAALARSQSTACTTAPAHLPTIWLAGDSTTAPGGGHNGTEGWGQFLQYSFGTRAFINNSAYAGRSMRSFTREGRFDRIAAAVTPGDWVVIEMGINDGGSIDNANGRGACPGDGDQTCTAVYQNITETVLTFPAYQQNAARLMLARGASVILSSREPVNSWQTGVFAYTPDRFTWYAQLSAEILGGPSNNVFFVDHGSYSAKLQENFGKSWVDAQYPMDNTHTAPLLADYVSKAWVLALKCGSSPLAGLVVNATARIETKVGSCLLSNGTAPV